MTRWQILTALLCITQAALAQNQGCMGIEITEAFRNGNARIKVGYAISGQWSAEARSAFHICRIPHGQEDTAVSNAPSMELLIRYWPHKCYSGTYISFSTISIFRKSTDIMLNIGYSIPVFKNTCLDIGYGIKLFDSIINKSSRSGAMTLEIYYTF